MQSVTINQFDRNQFVPSARCKSQTKQQNQLYQFYENAIVQTN